MPAPNAHDTRPVILVVDDDPIDRSLVERAFVQAGNKVVLQICSDGMTAWRYLNRKDEFAKSKLPVAALVDMNMPGVSGIDLLDKIKQDKNLNRLPVTIFSSSDLQEDIDACYDKHASAYVQKPDDQKKLTAIAATLSDFWTSVVRFA